jgi:hypothetical protein
MYLPTLPTKLIIHIGTKYLFAYLPIHLVRRIPAQGLPKNVRRLSDEADRVSNPGSVSYVVVTKVGTYLPIHLPKYGWMLCICLRVTAGSTCSSRLYWFQKSTTPWIVLPYVCQPPFLLVHVGTWVVDTVEESETQPVT